MKFSALVLTVTVFFTMVGSAVAAGPPATGSKQPESILPKPIKFGFVGAAVVGPKSSCTNTTAPDGTIAHMCTDVALRYAKLYRRVNDAAPWKRTFISNGSDRVLFTAPYGKGWQWVWAPTIGYGVMMARDLYEFGPIS